MRYNISAVALLVLFSFCHDGRPSLRLNKVYADLCDIYASLSLKKDSLIVIERENPDEGGKDASFFYRAAYKSGDTLLQKKNIAVDQPSAKRIRNELKASSFYIDTIAHYKFNYDKIPDILVKTFNKDEKVVFFKEQLLHWVYLTRNDKNGIWRVYASQKNGQEATFIDLSMNPEKPDFFLYDIIGDDSPEIFVIRKSYLMNRYLRDIDVYQISDVSLNKRAF